MYSCPEIDTKAENFFLFFSHRETERDGRREQSSNKHINVKITTLVHNKQIRTQQKGNPKPTGFLTAAPIGIRNEKKQIKARRRRWQRQLLLLRATNDSERQQAKKKQLNRLESRRRRLNYQYVMGLKLNYLPLTFLSPSLALSLAHACREKNRKKTRRTRTFQVYTLFLTQKICLFFLSLSLSIHLL